ncbi:hypothetical protein NQ318_022125 [Aromia moschata]|uniref:Uncharacterized protein n=1 Tax=Aromia moschata TaxID=1265417 RepID=A0AAV8Z7Q1_9CUCU|nr:hypothetical protein NQ318_022125 [Aromia moschata]
MCISLEKDTFRSFERHFLNSTESGNHQIIEQKFGEPGHGHVQEVQHTSASKVDVAQRLKNYNA